MDLTKVSKIVTRQLNDQFSGCDQQDPHELLMFLTDGSHQDLIKVNKKEFTATE